jgi:hypothetical protein
VGVLLNFGHEFERILTNEDRALPVDGIHCRPRTKGRTEGYDADQHKISDVHASSLPWRIKHLWPIVAPLAYGGVRGRHLHPGSVVGVQQVQRRPRIATLGNAEPTVIVPGVQDEGVTVMDGGYVELKICVKSAKVGVLVWLYSQTRGQGEGPCQIVFRMLLSADLVSPADTAEHLSALRI